MHLNTDHFERRIKTLESSLVLLNGAVPESIDYDIFCNAVVKGFELTLETGGKLLRRPAPEEGTVDPWSEYPEKAFSDIHKPIDFDKHPDYAANRAAIHDFFRNHGMYGWTAPCDPYALASLWSPPLLALVSH